GMDAVERRPRRARIAQCRVEVNHRDLSLTGDANGRGAILFEERVEAARLVEGGLFVPGEIGRRVDRRDRADDDLGAGRLAAVDHLREVGGVAVDGDVNFWRVDA